LRATIPVSRLSEVARAENCSGNISFGPRTVVTFSTQ
jgi:hypothetical protein